MAPDTEAMAADFDGLGLLHAEALSFALAALMPRPDAQTRTKALVAEAVQSNTSLADTARNAYPDLPPGLFQTAQHLGQAPAQARAFANRVDVL
jgi:3-carboxy-cis,cis-muconate cycloisomerase